MHLEDSRTCNRQPRQRCEISAIPTQSHSFLADKQLLSSLPTLPLPKRNDGCLPNTRTAVLRDIGRWMDDKAATRRVYWLTGLAGVGKSTVTHHVTQALRNAERLAASVFFSRDSSGQITIETLIKALARQLAHRNARARKIVCEAIENDVSLTTSELFQRFLLDPLSKFSPPEPAAIVFDALDEFDKATDLLDILQESASRLPSNVRLLITSRYELDIADRMKSLHPRKYTLQQAEDSEIRAAFESRLGKIKNLEMPSRDQISKLVHLAQGLFIWVTTGCKYIATGRGVHPQRRLNDILLTSQPASPAETPIYELYSSALRHLFPQDAAKSELRCFRSTIGSILVARKPLTVQQLQTILGKDVVVQDMVTLLGCVLSEHVGGTIRTIHTSFVDYITDDAKCTDRRLVIHLKNRKDRFLDACKKCTNHFFCMPMTTKISPSSRRFMKDVSLYLTHQPTLQHRWKHAKRHSSSKLVSPCASAPLSASGMQDLQEAVMYLIDRQVGTHNCLLYGG